MATSSLRVDPSYISSLQSNTKSIRNMCILAHVDHGKTTLSDSLVGSNGLFSHRLVGKLRYLDSTEEEQARGITMQSSAISLLFRPEDRGVGAQNAPSSAGSAAGAAAVSEEYLVNLVDSPGHIDFSSDVSTAARVCDGALLIVDAIEGVCTQTRAVIFKALRERMTPCLVLNKLDRLCMELQLTPIEAFHHLRRVIENVNALAYALVTSEIRAQDALDVLKVVAGGAGGDSGGGASSEHGATHDVSTGKTETAATAPVREAGDEVENFLFAQWTFAPEKGNVIFASAIDCWGFATPRFANMWAKKLADNNASAAVAAAAAGTPVPPAAATINAKLLARYMFEDVYFNARTGKIMKCYSSDAESGENTPPPLFASMVLEPLWKLYKTALGSGVGETAAADSDVPKAAKMAKRALGVTLSDREVNTRDPRGTLRTILNRWLPLSEAVLRMVVRCMPDPIQAQKQRLPTLMDLPPVASSGLSEKSLLSAMYQRTMSVRKSIENCDITVSNNTSNSEPDPEAFSSASSAIAADLVIFVTKMMNVRLADLSEPDRAAIISKRHAKAMAANGGEGYTGDTSDVFIALARVFSGSIHRNQSQPLYVLSSRYAPYDTPAINNVTDVNSVTDEVPACLANKGVTRINSQNLGLYLCLGPSYASIKSAYAGNIIGILGLEEHVLKTATLTSTWACQPMRAMTFQAQPMLRVALEPSTYSDLMKLEKGLKMLHQYDAVVEIGIDEQGQHTMTCLGELHLEHCLKALIERFAECPVKASEPLISLCETILPFSRANPLAGGAAASMTAKLPPPWSDMPGLSNSCDGCYTLDTHIHDKNANMQRLVIKLRCLPIPTPTMHALVDQATQTQTALVTELVAHLNKSQAGVPPVTAAALSRDGNGSWSPVAGMWRDFVTTFTKSSSTSATETTGDDSEASEEILGPTLASVFLRPVVSNGEKSSAAAGTESSNERSIMARESLSRLLALGPPGNIATASAGTSNSTNLTGRNNSNMLVLASNVAIQLYREGVPHSSTESDSSYSTVSAQDHPQDFHALFRRLYTTLITAFQVACTAGPLMKEPLTGVCFAVEEVRMSFQTALHSTDISNISSFASTLQDEHLLKLVSSMAVQTPSAGAAKSASSVAASSAPVFQSPYSGSLISLLTESLHLSMLSCPLRVVEPVYNCHLQCDQSQLGNLYGVLSRRRGHVIAEDVIDGTSLFILSAHLPILESFGFSQELLNKSSGEATAPMLQFSHWALREKDPFWRPTTEEEREDFGEASTLAGNAMRDNPVRVVIDKTRKRKGLVIEEKVVASAEKQRTISKKK